MEVPLNERNGNACIAIKGGKETSPKKTASAKPAASAKTKSSARKISAEERYKMTEVAAYFLAERNGFKGNPVEYWEQAEAQISQLLG